MGSTLIIRRGFPSKATWMPGRDTFEIVLERIAEQFESSDPTLAAFVLEPIGGFPFLELSSLEAPQFRKIMDTVILMLERDLLEHGAGLDTRDLSELKALLLLDDRAKGKFPDRTGRIALRGNSEWNAPWWVYDLLLEVLSAYISRIFGLKPIVDFLLQSRTIVNKNACNLVELDSSDLELFIEPLEWIRVWYTGGKVSLAPEFEKELYPRVITLYQLFRDDPRARDKAWPEYWRN